MIFSLLTCQNYSYRWESDLFHKLIYHHYLQYKFWNQSRPGNFIDAHRGTEPRSPWISCVGFALLTTTNISLTKLPMKRWFGRFSAEGVRGGIFLSWLNVNEIGQDNISLLGRKEKLKALVLAYCQSFFPHRAMIWSGSLNKNQEVGDQDQSPLCPIL